MTTAPGDPQAASMIIFTLAQQKVFLSLLNSMSHFISFCKNRLAESKLSVMCDSRNRDTIARSVYSFKAKNHNEGQRQGQEARCIVSISKQLQ